MNRRRTLFVNHTAQWHYLKIVGLAMFVPTCLATACLYYIIWQTVANELAIPELIAHALFPAFHRVNQIIIFGMPIVCGFILFSALHLSHRLAGPLYRIEKELDAIAEKHDFTKKITIRPKDQLHSLVNKINRVIHIASSRKIHPT